jgi:hypothetical protein
MTDFKNLSITLMISGLFVFCLMAFVITTQVENNSNQTITENEILNRTYSDLSTELNNVQSNSEESSGSFGAITPTQQYGEVEITAIVSPTKIFKSICVGLYNGLIRFPMNVLGVPPVVASLISGIFILSLIIGIWAVWKGAIS